MSIVDDVVNLFSSEFHIGSGNINRGWSYTKKGPGRRHNNAGANHRLRQIKPFGAECDERYRTGVYSNEFWARWDRSIKLESSSPWRNLINKVRNILRRR